MAKKAVYNYFNFFTEMAECAKSAADYLKKCFANYESEDIKVMVEKMHEIEHNADLKKHEMHEKLLREFLPPIDRDDIMELSAALDQVVDGIEDVVLRLYMFDIRSLRDEAKQIADIVVSLCDNLTALLGSFEGFKKKLPELKEQIISINNLEEQADKIYIEAMHTLYTGTASAAELCAWKEIYDFLERCCDRCEHVADAVENVILKNS